jgi:thiamine kinase
VRRLPGGLTNEAWLLDTEAGQAVLRLNSPYREWFGVDRYREATVLAAVSRLGLAPDVWFNDPAGGFLVTEYIDGRTWTAADFRESGQQRKLLTLLAKLQSIGVDLPRFDYLAHLDHYRGQLDHLGIPLPPELADLWRQWRPAIADFQAGDWQPVLCHHDLTPDNILERSGYLYLIDWEYSGLGHAAMDFRALGPDLIRSEAPVVGVLCRLMDGFWFLLREATARTD